MTIWNGVVHEGREWATDGAPSINFDEGLFAYLFDTHRCSSISKDIGFGSRDCLDVGLCSMCHIDPASQLRLKGLCQNAQLRYFDIAYYIYKYNHDRVAFRCEERKVFADRAP